MPRLWSIRARLGLAAALVLIAFLSSTGVILDRAYRDSVEDAAREQLRLRVLGLLGTAELVDGLLSLPPSLPEPRFNQPGSGLYARLLDVNGRPLWTSRSSASRADPEAAGLALAPAEERFEALEEGDYPLYRYGIGVLWEGPEGDDAYTLWVSTSRAPYLAETRGFRRTLFTLLGGAGATLLALQLVVLGAALRPLSRIEGDVERIERGEAARLEGQWPEELAGLARNLNLLIDHERGRQQRYRNTLDDLAHSLKTPLAILRNALAAPDDKALAEATRQIDRMDTIVGHQLQRASVGANPLSEVRTALAPAIARIAAGLARLHADAQRQVDVAVDEALVVAVDERDVYEMLGNLLENACKYGRRRVRASATLDGDRVRLVIEDDGPGVPEALRRKVLARGARADTATTGQGIGLAVVAEIVAAYDGELSIGTSELGGAAVRLELPAAVDQSASVRASKSSSEPAASKRAMRRIGRQQTAQSSK